jgi:LacI family transcriptional regulator
MTYTALSKLIEQFNDQDEKTPLHQETLEAQLIIRESTGKIKKLN